MIRFFRQQTKLRTNGPVKNSPGASREQKKEHDLKYGGKLTFCKVCEGAEGSLTTECPGEPMRALQYYRVYSQNWDYANGTWVEGA